MAILTKESNGRLFSDSSSFVELLSLCFFPFCSVTMSDPVLLLSHVRCRLSGGLGLSPGLGHAVLDQLHHLHHHPPHGRPEPLGRRWQAHGGHHVRRRSPPSLRLRWVPGVGASALFHFVTAVEFWDVGSYTARLIFAVNVFLILQMIYVKQNHFLTNGKTHG